MELQFWCAAWPDSRMVQHRLNKIEGLGEITMDADGRGLRVRVFCQRSAEEVAICLRELGWRPKFY